MKRHPSIGWFLILGSIALSLACGERDRSASGDGPVADRPLRVRTTCFPVDWLVERIGGDRIDRQNVLPEGEDPPYWHPSAELISDLARADLIVVNGATFEKWMETATLPLSKVVDSAGGLDLIEIEEQTHSHGVEGKHSHAGTDPHTWSDPLTYAGQAESIHRRLVEADPGNSEYYDANLEVLTAELKDLDKRYEEILGLAQSIPMASNHPSFGYLARRYGLDIRSFDFDPEEPPAAEALEDFLAWAATADPPVLLWEAEPTPAVRAAFPESVRHVYMDPLEQPGSREGYDYLEQATANLGRFEAMLATLKHPRP